MLLLVSLSLSLEDKTRKEEGKEQRLHKVSFSFGWLVG